MSDDLLLIVTKQSGLRREEDKLEASARGQADVVLRADAVTHEERRSPLHLNVGGCVGWCDSVGASRLRQPDREGRGESSGACDEQDATRSLSLQCIAVLHIILLSRLVRGLWGWRVQSLQRSLSAANRLRADSGSPDDADPFQCNRGVSERVIDARSYRPSFSNFLVELVAQHLGHEGHQFAKRGEARYLPGRNVLDAADYAAWQLGAHVEVQDEGAVGEQFEPGRGWRGSGGVPRPLHALDNTGRRSHPR